MNLARFLILFFSTTCISIVYSQNLGNSPYSQYGIGDIASSSLQRPNQMGEAGSASGSVNFLNNLNPALLAQNRYTTLDFGLAFKTKLMTSSTTRELTNGFNFIHGALLVPVTERWSSLICIKPQSSINYTFNNSSLIQNDTNKSNYSYKGRGGLTEFFWSNGVKINKILFVGTQLSYLFGKTDDEVKIAVPNSFFNNVILKSSNSSHIGVKPGIVLKIPEKRKPVYAKDSLSDTLRISSYRSSWLNQDSTLKLTGKSFSIGLTYETFFNTTNSQMSTLQKVDEKNFAIILDTINRNNFSIQIPPSVRLGLAYEKIGKWAYVADVKLGFWKEYKNEARTNGENVRNTLFIGLGGEHFKSLMVKSIERYFQLRYGAYYSQQPYVIRNVLIDEMAITGGFSFLMPKIKSEGMQYPKFINVGFAFGQRGTTENFLIRENFVRINFGVTVNDIWFVRPRID